MFKYLNMAKPVSIDLMTGYVLNKGKRPPTKAARESLIKTYICNKIAEGLSLGELDLTGAGDLPQQNEIYTWSESDPEFKRSLQKAKSIRAFNIFEDFQKQIREFAKDPKKENKEIIQAVEKIIAQQEKYVDAVAESITLVVPRVLPNETWNAVRTKR